MRRLVYILPVLLVTLLLFAGEHFYLGETGDTAHIDSLVIANVNLSDGSDRFSASVNSDKLTFWNDAATPVSLATLDSVGHFRPNRQNILSASDGDPDSLIVCCTNNVGIDRHHDAIAQRLEVNGNIFLNSSLYFDNAMTTYSAFTAGDRITFDDATNTYSFYADVWGYNSKITCGHVRAYNDITADDSLKVGGGVWVRKLFQSTGGDSIGCIYYNSVRARVDTVWMTQ